MYDPVFNKMTTTIINDIVATSNTSNNNNKNTHKNEHIETISNKNVHIYANQKKKTTNANIFSSFFLI